MKARINRNQVICDHCWKPVSRGHELGLWSAGTTPRAFCGYLCLREWLTRMLVRDHATTDAYSEALGRAAAAMAPGDEVTELARALLPGVYSEAAA